MKLLLEPLFIKSILRMDERGFLNKVLHVENMQKIIGESRIAEIFSTSSYESGTIRGMHFQTSPGNAIKIVWVTHGAVLDVVVDLRRNESFGKCMSFNLSSDNGYIAVIPQGFAHGFQTLEPNTVVNYATNYQYVPKRDTGVKWDSLNFNWPLPPKNISIRDSNFIGIEDYS